MASCESLLKPLERLLVFLLTIWKPLWMAEIKLHCAFVKDGTRSVVNYSWWLGCKYDFQNSKLL
jgi:hypothetical protein